MSNVGPQLILLSIKTFPSQDNEVIIGSRYCEIPQFTYKPKYSVEFHEKIMNRRISFRFFYWHALTLKNFR